MSSKSKALNKVRDPIDIKWDKYNAEHGKTPTGKRKWHYYNSKVKNVDRPQVHKNMD